jgi:hypothetical protein
MSDDTSKDELKDLLDELLSETQVWSGSWSDHPAFWSLVERGREVLPLLLVHLEQKDVNPWPLFSLAYAILDDGPTIAPEDAGRLGPVRTAWIAALTRETEGL